MNDLGATISVAARVRLVSRSGAPIAHKDFWYAWKPVPGSPAIPHPYSREGSTTSDENGVMEWFWAADVEPQRTQLLTLTPKFRYSEDDGGGKAILRDVPIKAIYRYEEGQPGPKQFILKPWKAPARALPPGVSITPPPPKEKPEEEGPNYFLIILVGAAIFGAAYILIPKLTEGRWPWER